MTGFGVIGLEHLHVFELVDGLLDAGAEERGYAGDDGPLLDLYASWRTETPRRTVDQVLADPSIELIVLAGIPAGRADTAVAALRAGKAVLSDKPGVTSRAQLDAVTSAARSTGLPWWVLFSERFGNRAMIEAVRRVHAGEIGRVVDVVGLGPHTLAGDGRPEWFWDPTRSGGILVDIGSHQIDQFCAVVDPEGRHDLRITWAAHGNVDSAEHPSMEDVGRLTIEGAGAVGNHRVDYLSPPGLGAWGDGRLMITGTEGTLEVRTNVDPAGAGGAEHLIRVDGTRTQRLDCSGVELDWATRLLGDLRNGTTTLMPTGHAERVSRLALDAREAAVAHHPWEPSD